MMPSRHVQTFPGLAAYHHPATATPVCGPVVLLHGWGCDSRSWELLLPHLQSLTDVIALDLPGFGGSEPLPDWSLENLLPLIESRIPQGATLMGWSLGGMLAVALAARLPDRVSRVISLAANLRFVAGADYPAAMAPAINRQFNRLFAEDPGAALKRFGGLLAQGDEAERSLLRRLREAGMPGEPHTSWLDALALLASLDNRVDFARLDQPGLHLLGDADVLVPATAAAALRQHNARQQVVVLPGAAHALHWSQPETVAQWIAGFLTADTAPQLDKRRVAQSFSRAAASYDAVAELQRAVGGQLMAQLPDRLRPDRILDLGCGTGYFTRALAARFPGADVLGLDIAPGMLEVARRHQGAQVQWLCADAESLPLADASVDLVYSSLAIQWCEDLPRLFRELTRILRPGGWLVFSTLGPGTLIELKTAWQQVDAYVHVNRFKPLTALEQTLAQARLVKQRSMEETRRLDYERLVDLTRELKSLGAHNSNQGQSRGLTGRRKLEQLKTAYESFRQAGRLPASYEVYYLCARKPADSSLD